MHGRNIVYVSSSIAPVHTNGRKHEVDKLGDGIPPSRWSSSTNATWPGKRREKFPPFNVTQEKVQNGKTQKKQAIYIIYVIYIPYATTTILS